MSTDFLNFLLTQLQHLTQNSADGNPCPEDIELARELLKELDPESQDWYRQTRWFEGL